MSNAEKAGETVFMKLSPGERADLKKFMTGQIQNILANQYGIGGVKTLKSQIDGSINAQLNHEAFIEKVASRIVHSNRVNARDTIVKALEAAAKKAVAEVVGDAAKHITFTFTIGEPKPAELDNDNYGKF